MIFGDLGGLNLPDICLTGEEKPRKNLTQETCPDRESNPGPLRDTRACYPLSHSGGQLYGITGNRTRDLSDDRHANHCIEEAVSIEKQNSKYLVCHGSLLVFRPQFNRRHNLLNFKRVMICLLLILLCNRLVHRQVSGKMSCLGVQGPYNPLALTFTSLPYIGRPSLQPESRLVWIQPIDSFVRDGDNILLSLSVILLIYLMQMWFGGCHCVDQRSRKRERERLSTIYCFICFLLTYFENFFQNTVQTTRENLGYLQID